MDKNVKEVSVYDLGVAMVPPGGVAADLSHLEGSAKVKGYAGERDQPPKNFMGDALKGCSLVLIPAGVPRKPGQSRDDLFKINADIAKGIVQACAEYCPNAILAMVVNPVNSVVPAMARPYEKKSLNPMNIVGVTTLDCVRANKFVSELVPGTHPSEIDIPVIGGHAGVTILPLFSQDPAGKKIPADQVKALDKRVQEAGTEVVEAKNGKGSATLSMAYAGWRLGSAVLSGLAGENKTECAYVKTDIVEGMEFFTSKVVFGKNGVEKVHPIGTLNEHETQRLEEAKEALKAEIKSGLLYAESNSLE